MIIKITTIVHCNRAKTQQHKKCHHSLSSAHVPPAWPTQPKKILARVCCCRNTIFSGPEPTGAALQSRRAKIRSSAKQTRKKQHIHHDTPRYTRQKQAKSKAETSQSCKTTALPLQHLYVPVFGVPAPVAAIVKNSLADSDRRK